MATRAGAAMAGAALQNRNTEKKINMALWIRRYDGFFNGGLLYLKVVLKQGNLKIPNHNIQIPNKFQISISKFQTRAMVDS
jgi:hypothetical protein